MIALILIPFVTWGDVASYLHLVSACAYFTAINGLLIFWRYLNFPPDPPTTP